MADFALATADGISFDVYMRNDDIATDDGLATAVLCSLFFDRRCEIDELPPGQTDRRGWWGDEFNPDGDDGIGSKLWLLAREKPTPSILARAETYAEESLSWMIQDQVAASVTVSAEFGKLGRLDGLALFLSVVIVRPDGTKAPLKYGVLWDQLSASNGLE